ncbi:MAG: HD domain-containing phosphohydrolase, partial [Coriobacteriales bacterium]
EPFYEQDLEGVELVAHIIQISLENDQLLERTRAQLYGTLMALAELVGLRRPDYEDHAAKVAELAVSTGIMLGLTTQEIADLRVASVLHDVGMLEAPDAITCTDRPLTPAEEATIRRHPAAGARILTTARLDEKIKEAVLCHHERLDGSGYFSGLKGDAIPLSARIIGVCDTYVALTSERPYRHALSERAAFAEVQRAAGRLFDPRVVDALGVVTGNIRAGAAVGDELALMLGQVG